MYCSDDGGYGDSFGGNDDKHGGCACFTTLLFFTEFVLSVLLFLTGLDFTILLFLTELLLEIVLIVVLFLVRLVFTTDISH